MTITITWQGALLTAIAVLGIILLIYLIDQQSDKDCKKRQ